MANILMRERQELGDRMNEYFTYWKWIKMKQWVYEKGLRRRMNLESLEIPRLDRRFVDEAIAEGIENDHLEWEDQNGFVWDGIDDLLPNLQNNVRPNIVPNVLDEEFDGYCALQSVEKNKEGCVKNQQELAKAAQKLCHIVGAPTVENFKHIIKSHQLMNCPVTLDDVKTAQDTHGKDTSHIKGKTT